MGRIFHPLLPTRPQRSTPPLWDACGCVLRSCGYECAWFCVCVYVCVCESHKGAAAEKTCAHTVTAGRECVIRQRKQQQQPLKWCNLSKKRATNKTHLTPPPPTAHQSTVCMLLFPLIFFCLPFAHIDDIDENEHQRKKQRATSKKM